MTDAELRDRAESGSVSIDPPSAAPAEFIPAPPASATGDCRLRIDEPRVSLPPLGRVAGLMEAMMREDPSGQRLLQRVYGGAAMLLALVIFLLDVLSPLQGAVAVLYTTVVLLIARAQRPLLIIGTSLFVIWLALAGYLISHLYEPFGSPAVRLAVSLVAIGITTLLCLRNQKIAKSRRESELRYRTIFNAAALPIWEEDWSDAYRTLRSGELHDHRVLQEAARSGIIRDANDATATMFGLDDRAALIGNTIADHLTLAAEFAFGRIIAALIRGETTIVEEARFRTAQGDLVDVVVHVTLPPSDGQWQRVLLMAMDVTERRRAEARFKQAQAELTHVSRVTTLGQLAASIAHEVNQPLSAIMAYAMSGKRWLNRDVPETAEAITCLEQIAANGGRASDVIARVRALARNSQPQQRLMSLGRLVEETAALLSLDLNANGVGLQLDIAPELPPVKGDPIQIQQVVMNLMLNAEQAMMELPDDARTLCVKAVAEDGEVIVNVSDCGTGIQGDPEALFAPFFTTKPAGLGMGLSICRSIIERHGGRLLAANNPESGATFTFRLPAARNSELTT